MNYMITYDSSNILGGTQADRMLKCMSLNTIRDVHTYIYIYIYIYTLYKCVYIYREREITSLNLCIYDIFMS